MLHKYCGCLLLQSDCLLEWEAVPFMLLANPACPHLPRVPKGYTGSLPREEESFHVYHRIACCVLEQAFGRLRVCWHILLKCTDNYQFVPSVALPACMLHNFSELEWETCSDLWDGAISDCKLGFLQLTSRPPSTGTHLQPRYCFNNFLPENIPSSLRSFPGSFHG